MSSALKSPSYLNAKNVNVNAIKSRFDESDVTPDDVIKDNVLSISVRDGFTVMKSPPPSNSKVKAPSSAYVKGHHKTASLPPASLATPSPHQNAPPIQRSTPSESSRVRSLSETQGGSFSVKKIVTAIEKGGLHEEGAEGLHRSLSMPPGAKKFASPVSIASRFSPVGERSPTSFFIGETANLNNNNSTFPSTAHFSAISLRKKSSTKKSSKHKSHFAPEFLQVIEKVGAARRVN